MVTLDEAKQLLSKPIDDKNNLPDRDQSTYQSLHRFDLPSTRQYQQQFGDMYFLRLTKIKPAVEQLAAEVFGDVIVAGEPPKRVERVLDVRQGEFCWVAGTIYMDMPFKPSILEDVAKDRLLSIPSKVQKYIPQPSNDSKNPDDDILAEGRGSVMIMLEDESGRIRLVGKALRNVILVTGCIIAAMGTENENGELEVLDIVFPDLSPQPERWQLTAPLSGSSQGNGPPAKRRKQEGREGTPSTGNGPRAEEEDAEMADAGFSWLKNKNNTKIAIVSGLNFSGPHAASAVQTGLLLEYLLGEALGPEAQRGASHISRLIVAGNSIDQSKGLDAAEEASQSKSKNGVEKLEKHAKKYGYDSSTYNPVPSSLLDEFLAHLLPSMPVTLMPGAHDPANVSLPQQPMHAAIFPQARLYSSAGLGRDGAADAQQDQPGWLDAVTNPWDGEIDGWRFLGTSGQTLDDMAKYVPSSGGGSSNDRLDLMEATCRWRCCAPTAPDTLWSYPFQEDDPFVLETAPHVYFVGSQPAFGTRLITGRNGQQVRLVAVPAFSETRELVLIDTETLEVTCVKME